MIKQTVLFNKEPNWQINRMGTRYQLPERVQSWVYEAGSLTKRLRKTYGQSVTVLVLFQHWGVPFLTERRLLAMREQRFCLIREVLLQAEGKPLILARTIIPTATIKAANHHSLNRLGTRPLGEVIFSYPKLQRIAMDISLITPSVWAEHIQSIAVIQQPVWGRRTIYAIKHRPMLVSEFFLSEVLQHNY